MGGFISYFKKIHSPLGSGFRNGNITIILKYRNRKFKFKRPGDRILYFRLYYFGQGMCNFHLVEQVLWNGKLFAFCGPKSEQGCSSTVYLQVEVAFFSSV